MNHEEQLFRNYENAISRGYDPYEDTEDFLEKSGLEMNELVFVFDNYQDLSLKYL